jgi:mono/diheme cytochrome c family protein
MNIRETVLVSALVLMPWASRAQEKPTPAVPTDVASGKQTYMDYCAACHGADGRGHGPTASALKTPPANLRTLAIRHDGKFPEDYVARVVRSGDPSFSGHGSSDMPIWGPVFSMQENGDETGVRRRIKNLCNYLASIQDKKS